MRVFIGIELNDKTKKQLFEIEQQLKNYCSGGNFTAFNNFHLTMQFIGQATADDVEQLKTVLRNVAAKSMPFEITVSALGNFPKKKRYVVWVSSEQNNGLLTLYNQLHVQFNHQQRRIQKKPFIPHITLGRNLLLTESFVDLEQLLNWKPISIKIDHITLFESVRVNEQLVYRPIEHYELNKAIIGR